MAAPTRGMLGQSAPSASVLTDIYTCPALRNALGRVIVTNRAGSVASFRVSVATDGAADTNAQYIAYDKPIAENDPGSTIAFFMGDGDVLRVFASNANLSFSFTGIEQDD